MMYASRYQNWNLHMKLVEQIILYEKASFTLRYFLQYARSICEYMMYTSMYQNGNLREKLVEQICLYESFDSTFRICVNIWVMHVYTKVRICSRKSLRTCVSMKFLRVCTESVRIYDLYIYISKWESAWESCRAKLSLWKFSQYVLNTCECMMHASIYQNENLLEKVVEQMCLREKAFWQYVLNMCEDMTYICMFWSGNLRGKLVEQMCLYAKSSFTVRTEYVRIYELCIHITKWESTRESR